MKMEFIQYCNVKETFIFEKLVDYIKDGVL